LPSEARLKVLIDSIQHADSLLAYSDHSKSLRSFLAREDTLVLEGFVRFRLKDTYEFWESCVEHAAESWLLEYETEEFLKLLRSFADIQQPRTGDVTVSATPAGDYQLLDEYGCKIEDEAFSISGAIAKEDALVSLLVAVAPRRIWACGLKREAQDAIASGFGSRARFLTD
jgi:putative sporulation protein YtxC